MAVWVHADTSAAEMFEALEWTGSRRELPTALYVPPGWPDEVSLPGAPRWENTASAYLFDCCPPDFRAYPVLRRHPVVLAAFAAEFVESQVRAAKEGLAEARVRLEDPVNGTAAKESVVAWQNQLAHFLHMRRAVALIEESLRGKVFIRKL